MPIARKVKVRRVVPHDPGGPGPAPEHRGPESAVYTSYLDETTFRWAVVCQACYLTHDNESGDGGIGWAGVQTGRAFPRRSGWTMTEAGYREWRRRPAEWLGLDDAGPAPIQSAFVVPERAAEVVSRDGRPLDSLNHATESNATGRVAANGGGRW